MGVKCKNFLELLRILVSKWFSCLSFPLKAALGALSWDFCIQHYICIYFWYNQFGMTATRLGEYRPSMRTNPLLMQSNLGKPLLRGYTLPGPDFVYGHRNIDDPFGAAGAMMQLNNLVSWILAADWESLYIVESYYNRMVNLKNPYNRKIFQKVGFIFKY